MHINPIQMTLATLFVLGNIGVATGQSKICPQTPFAPTGGLSGPAVWSTNDTTTPAAAAAPARSWLNDPRLASAPRRSYQPYVQVLPSPGDGVVPISTDESRFRIGRDGDVLIVSFQTALGLNTENGTHQDSLYFGLADANSGVALTVTLPLDSASVTGPQALNATYSAYLYTQPDPNVPGSWAPDGTAGGTSAPTWLKNPARWTHNPADLEDLGNGLWGVNFKVSLAELGLSSITNDIRIFTGAQLVNYTWQGPAAPEPKAVLLRFRSPHITAGSMLDEMIPEDVSTWRELNFENECVGITLDKDKMGRKSGDGWVRSMPFTHDARLTLGAKIDSAGSSSPVLDGMITAEFRQRKWGTEASYFSWKTLESHEDPDLDLTYSFVRTELPLTDGEFLLHCDKNKNPDSQTLEADDSTCGIKLNDLIPTDPAWRETVYKNNVAHNCLFVEMNSRDQNLEIANAATYQNMNYAIASTVERVATINVEGLTELTGIARNRDVYLRVIKQNMPEPGEDTYNLNRNAMHRTRAEVNESFTCANDEDLCVEGNCVQKACDVYDGNIAYGCQDYAKYPDFVRDDNGDCWCLEQQPEACLPPPVNQADAPSNEGEQRLRASWPTYEVRPYVETGEVATVNGVATDVMLPMAPFGLYIDHEGELYGWTDELTALGGTLKKLTDDLYLLTVPDEGEVELLVSVTAVEPNTEAPLLDIQGTATRFGIFGALELVSLAASNEPADLRTSTVTVAALLEEDGNELVSNFNAPALLSPLPGALPTVATFVGKAGPSIVMEVVQLPLLGRLTVTAATRARVEKPQACGWFGGSSSLDTRFEIRDGTDAPLSFAGSASWACVPFALISL